MRVLSAGGAPVTLGSGVTAAQLELHEVVAWDYSWDVDDAVTYDDAGTERVDYIPDRSGDKNLIRDQGFYGPVFGKPICKGMLYIPSSLRFLGHPAVIADDDLGNGPHAFSLLTTTVDPTDPDTWMGGTSGLAQPYWCCACLRAKDTDPTNSKAWDAVQGSDGTTVSIFGDFVDGEDWACTTGVRGGIDLWPSTGIPQNENATVLIIVNVDGTDSWFEINTIIEDGTAFSFRDTTFDLADDAPARELFLGWSGRSGYFSFGAFKQGVVNETDVAAVRNFANGRTTRRDNVTPLPAEP